MPEKQVIILREHKKGRAYCAAPFTFGTLFQAKKVAKNREKSGKD
jgi:hypothetical protein